MCSFSSLCNVIEIFFVHTDLFYPHHVIFLFLIFSLCNFPLLCNVTEILFVHTMLFLLPSLCNFPFPYFLTMQFSFFPLCDFPFPHCVIFLFHTVWFSFVLSVLFSLPSLCDCPFPHHFIFLCPHCDFPFSLCQVPRSPWRFSLKSTSRKHCRSCLRLRPSSLLLLRCASRFSSRHHQSRSPQWHPRSAHHPSHRWCHASRCPLLRSQPSWPPRRNPPLKRCMCVACIHVCVCVCACVRACILVGACVPAWMCVVVCEWAYRFTKVCLRFSLLPALDRVAEGSDSLRTKAGLWMSPKWWESP